MFYATAKEMEKLDKLAVRNGLEIRQMMELAGWQMVRLFEKLKIPKRAKVVIFAGSGNKGGDGLSAARHLVNNGWKPFVVLLSRGVSADARHHLRLARKMRMPVVLYRANKSAASRALRESVVIIDALIGYHLDGPPRGEFGEAIELMNEAKKKIISYDLPSGLDATSGVCFAPCVRAFATLTLALPKRGFRMKQARSACGRIFLADIGIPEFLYDRVRPGSRPRFASAGAGPMRIKTA